MGLHRIEIWIGDLDAIAGLSPAIGDCLSPAETVAVGRYVRRADAQRAAASRAALRVILGRELGLAPADVPIGAGPYGKPELTDGARGRLHFNVSHTGASLAIGVCRTSPLGIDVERVSTETEIAENVLAASERARLGDLDGTARAEAFHRLWVRKEAILKAAGTGLHAAPETIEVPLAPRAACRPASLPTAFGAPQHWTLLDFQPDAAVAGCVAVPGKQAEIAEFFYFSGYSQFLDPSGVRRY